MNDHREKNAFQMTGKERPLLIDASEVFAQGTDKIRFVGSTILVHQQPASHLFQTDILQTKL